MITFKDIENANELIQTLTIEKGYKDKKTGYWVETSNEYAPVKERVIAFRRNHPQGQIIPEISFTENYIVCDCTILDENGKILAKGHSRGLGNKNFAIEDVESSAVGRALGFCGYGISTSIASAEEMLNVEDNEIFDEPFKDDLVKEFKSLYSNMEQVPILNGLNILSPEDMDSDLLVKYINLKKYGKK